MATAQVTRKWLQERAEDTLVFIASLRSKEREQMVKKLTAPRRLWSGNYSIMPVDEAKEIARRQVPDFKYETWENTVRRLLHLARAAKGDVTIEDYEASELRK